MQEFEITLRNYRVFSQQNPVEFRVSSGITFLLGINNIGKSALLRAFFELRPCVSKNALLVARDQGGRTEMHATFRVTLDRIANRVTSGAPIELRLLQGGAGWEIKITSRHPGDSYSVDALVVTTAIGKPSNDFATLVEEVFHQSLYVGSFRSSAVEASGALYDIQIGKNFVNQWDQWANGRRVEHSNQIDLLVEELRELFGFKKFAITVSEDKKHLDLKTDDGKFSLDELGDGIAHYVVVLGNAMVKRPKFIFIDEPEIGLHPRMQEVFVRALAAKAQHGLIATSHSVGLARSVADRLLTVTREESGKRRLTPFGEHREETLVQSISELGYSQYAELGGNHLLLVEGQTDLKAFREILRKFGLEQHFLIWSLNGSSSLKGKPGVIADQLGELKRLNARSYSIIFDSERTDSNMEMNADLKPFAELAIKLGYSVFPTDRHSTENYVSQAALDADPETKKCKALGQFDNFKDLAAPAKWDKSRNWLLFQQMKLEEFESTGLGKFINEKLRPAVSAGAQLRS